MSELEDVDAQPFGTQILHNATFKVDWTQVKQVARAGKGGGSYNKPCILADVKGYVVPLWVELTREDYDGLRLLKVQGIKVYTCTLGAETKNGYHTRIFAGGKDW